MPTICYHQPAARAAAAAVEQGEGGAGGGEAAAERQTSAQTPGGRPGTASIRAIDEPSLSRSECSIHDIFILPDKETQHWASGRCPPPITL